jgi:hypothetical protein
MTPITPPPRTTYMYPVLANLIFWGPTPAPTSTPTPPPTLNLAMFNCSAPLFRPASLLSLLPRSNLLPKVSILTSAELEDATVVSAKSAGGCAGECYDRFCVPRSIHPTPPPIHHLISLYICLYNTSHPNISNSTNPLCPSSGCAHAYREKTQARLIPSFSHG